jgi:hypothetical protein
MLPAWLNRAVDHVVDFLDEADGLEVLPAPSRWMSTPQRRPASVGIVEGCRRAVPVPSIA